MIAPGELEFTPSGYSAASNSLGGVFFITPAEHCGVEGALLSPATLERTGFLFWCTAELIDNPPMGAGAVTATVDGSVAYGPSVSEQINSANPGLQGLQVTSASDDESNGDMSITELDPFVRCAPEANAYPDGATCSSFVPTGVTLERTWTTSSADHIATLRDAWRSTDGKAHEVKVDYYNEFEQESTLGVFEFPGATAFAPLTSGEHISLPPGPAMILYKHDSSTPEAGDGTNPQGAIVYDRPPSSPLLVKNPSAATRYPSYEAPYAFAVPAGGASVLRMSYIQGFALPEVEFEATAALAAFRAPTISIKAPADGAVLETESPAVAVSGSAADGGGAVSSVTVNGTAATLAGRRQLVGDPDPQTRQQHDHSHGHRRRRHDGQRHGHRRLSDPAGEGLAGRAHHDEEGPRELHAEVRRPARRRVRRQGQPHDDRAAQEVKDHRPAGEDHKTEDHRRLRQTDDRRRPAAGRSR